MSGPVMLLCQAVLYFTVMVVLFRARHRLGLGVFVCALGVMHFLETYLAAVFFIELPFGLISPGSTVMFSGKLAMILLLYIREDAETVRQPIYGLLIGNCLMVGLVSLLRLQSAVAVLHGYNPDLVLIDQIGMLMIWGTLLLFIDSIALILIYERFHTLIGNVGLRAFASLAAILTFDQAGFYTGLHLLAGTPPTALLGGWIAKIAAAACYSLMLSAYLHFFESRPAGSPAQSLGDVFSALTYRRRYEELLDRSSIDALTGALNRGQFETLGAATLALAAAQPRPVSLAIIDVDHFKTINDRYGHPAGDEVLKRLVGTLKRLVRTDDKLFRYGGEEFVLLWDELAHGAAVTQAERLRAAVPDGIGQGLDMAPTISMGVASFPDDGASLAELVRIADARLYMAKRQGRNRVVGSAEGPKPTPAI